MENKMLTEVNVKITYRDNTIQRINKIEKGDWLDLRAAEDVKLKTGEWRYIDLGVAMELPAGWEALVAPRGSTFKNFGILQFNSIGIIDNSFCGPNDWWKFPALAMRDTEIKKGDRICQFRLIENQPGICFSEEGLSENTDRSGFGSAGNK